MSFSYFRMVQKKASQNADDHHTAQGLTSNKDKHLL